MFSTIFDSLSSQGRLFRTLARNPKFWCILGLDILLVVLAHYLAYVLRFESHLKPDQLLRFAGLLPLILLVKIPLFYLCAEDATAGKRQAHGNCPGGFQPIPHASAPARSSRFIFRSGRCCAPPPNSRARS